MSEDILKLNEYTSKIRPLNIKVAEEAKVRLNSLAKLPGSFAKLEDIADLIVVDIGVNADIDNPCIKNRKIRKSTWNIAKREAMTYGEAVQAVLTGIEIVTDAVKDGYKLLSAGEMGIGNTTTSAAVLCALTGISPEQVTGKGAGLSEESYRHKIEVIKTALKNNMPNPYVQ